MDSTSSASNGAAPEPRRRAVTPFNDTGHVPWAELSAGEKTGRAAQQTFNFGMVVVGVVLTVCSFFFFFWFWRGSSFCFCLGGVLVEGRGEGGG